LTTGGFSDQPVFSEKDVVGFEYDDFSDQGARGADEELVSDGGGGSGFWSLIILFWGVEDLEIFNGVEGIGGESSLSSVLSSELSSIAQQVSSAFDTFQNIF
jgi:hypothetical protein